MWLSLLEGQDVLGSVPLTSAVQTGKKFVMIILVMNNLRKPNYCHSACQGVQATTKSLFGMDNTGPAPRYYLDTSPYGPRTLT